MAIKVRFVIFNEYKSGIMMIPHDYPPTHLRKAFINRMKLFNSIDFQEFPYRYLEFELDTRKKYRKNSVYEYRCVNAELNVK